MAVLVTAIHVSLRIEESKTWMAGTSPAMTLRGLSRRLSLWGGNAASNHSSD
jgi:hypothetical protein